MIIRSADGDDEERIQEMEAELCRRHRNRRKQLYPILRHADFHNTRNDRPEHWHPAAYAAFSGTLLKHKLGYEELKALLDDFVRERERHLASWNAVIAEDLQRRSTERSPRDYVAISHRYMCGVVGKYHPP